jgi:radical SAM protein with 4Fe4S-binding SPASM domain
MDKNSFFVYRPPGGEDGPDGMLVLLHSRRPRWLIANETFAELATALQKGASIDETARFVAARFGIDPATATRDLCSVADHLNGHLLAGPGDDFPRRLPRLRNLFVHITERCNLSCPHCYYEGTGHSDFPPDLLKRIIDETADSGAENITLSGGEPLLYGHLKEMLEYAGGRLGITLLTNGTLLDREWAAFLSGFGDVRIQISLDGSREDIHDTIRGRGSFRKTLKAVEYLQEAGLGGSVNFAATVMAHNLHDLPGIIDLTRRVGVPTVRFMPLRKKGRAGKEWDVVGAPVSNRDYEAFFDYHMDRKEQTAPAVEVSCGLSGFLLALPENDPLDEMWCPLGRNLVIRTDGRAYPCVLLAEEEFALGNVLHESLSAIMKSEGMFRVCKTLGERRTLIGECAACPWRNLCQGGCMGQALGDKGTLWERDRFCSYREALYEKAFARLAGRAAPSPPPAAADGSHQL